MGMTGEDSDGSFDQWTRNSPCIDGGEEMRKCLTNTSEILEKVKKRFYRSLAPMGIRKLLKKATAILKVDVMIFTAREIMYYLDNGMDLSNTPFYIRERTKEDLLDGLRKLIKDGVFYMGLLEGKNGKFNSKLFRSLKRKGLVDIEVAEFHAMTETYDKDLYSYQTMSSNDIYRLLVLRDLARKMIKERKAKISANPSPWGRPSCISGTKDTKNSEEAKISHDFYIVMQTKPVPAIRPLPQVLASLKEEVSNEEVDAMNKDSATPEPRPLSTDGDRKKENRLRRVVRWLANIFHS